MREEREHALDELLPGFTKTATGSIDSGMRRAISDAASIRNLPRRGREDHAERIGARFDRELDVIPRGASAELDPAVSHVCEISRLLECVPRVAARQDRARAFESSCQFLFGADGIKDDGGVQRYDVRGGTGCTAKYLSEGAMRSFDRAA